MTRVQAFVALGSNDPTARERIAAALSELERVGLRVAAVAPPVSGPYLDVDGLRVPGAPAVLNSVAEVWTEASPEDVLSRLSSIEAEAGRVRTGGTQRTLDLDLLVHGATVTAGPTLTLPHPRALNRAFVLQPWAEVAPHVEIPGTGASVLRHAARLRARDARAFTDLSVGAPLPLPALSAPLSAPARLSDRAALAAWRQAQGARDVGLVPTMGALHAGHASLVRRARAVCDAVLATIFVNPLQFGPHEDFARYPRTLDADLELLSASGADAVYLPSAADLYPPGFSTGVVPEGPALPFEGASRPGHFRGVSTVVLKLFQRARPTRAWFGQKDAQQVAVLRRMVLDLDLPVLVEVAPIVRDVDGLALSSRNRYLDATQRARALALPAALDEVCAAAAAGERDVARLLAPARARLLAADLHVEYVEIVEPDGMRALPALGAAPALVVGTVRAGATRLLDNRWVVAPGDLGPSRAL